VVRGGSWNNNQDNARAAYRNHNTPDNRNNNLGFRVVCSSHIVHPLQRRRPVLLPTGLQRVVRHLFTAQTTSGIDRRLRFAIRGEGFMMAQRRPAHTVD
jgi:hypothetical protein